MNYNQLINFLNQIPESDRDDEIQIYDEVEKTYYDVTKFNTHYGNDAGCISLSIKGE